MQAGAESRTGTRIREMRLARGLTQRQLASGAGLSVTVLRDLEQGITRTPRPVTLQQLADALGASPAELSGRAHGGRRARSRAPGTGHNGHARALRLRVLGPLAAWRGTSAVPLGSRRDKAVLAVLALHPGELMHRDKIIAAIWQSLPTPSTAAEMIQNSVSRLRRTLSAPDEPRVLATAGSRYQLVSSQVQLDLATYTVLASAATSARRSADCATAWDLYDQALALWANDPVADIEILRDTPVITGLRTRHACLVSDYAEDASSHGHHGRVLPYLLAQTERDPYDERAHACLMIAQAGLGNKAVALATYDHIQARLRNDGLVPGEQLRIAQTRILRNELICQPRPV